MIDKSSTAMASSFILTVEAVVHFEILSLSIVYSQRKPLKQLSLTVVSTELKSPCLIKNCLQICTFNLQYRSIYRDNYNCFTDCSTVTVCAETEGGGGAGGGAGGGV